MLVKRRIFNRYNEAGEEAFLEDMAKKGWMLREIRGFRYIFEQGDPAEYFYCVHWLQKRTHEDYEKWLDYMRSIGAEEVCVQGNCTIFRRPAAQGEFFGFESPQEELKYWCAIRRSVLLWMVHNMLWLFLLLMRLSETGESKAWYFANWLLLVLFLGATVESVWTLFRYVRPQIRLLKNKV